MDVKKLNFQMNSINSRILTCATYEENSIDAQNPNHTCPLK